MLSPSTTIGLDWQTKRLREAGQNLRHPQAPEFSQAVWQPQAVVLTMRSMGAWPAPYRMQMSPAQCTWHKVGAMQGTSHTMTENQASEHPIGSQSNQRCRLVPAGRLASRGGGGLGGLGGDGGGSGQSVAAGK